VGVDAPLGHVVEGFLWGGDYGVVALGFEEDEVVCGEVAGYGEDCVGGVVEACHLGDVLERVVIWVDARWRGLKKDMVTSM